MSLYFFFALYVCSLTIPGFAIQRALRINSNPFITSISISYSLFALSFIFCNYFSISATSFITSYNVILVSSVFYIIFSHLVKKISTVENHKKTIINPILFITATSIIYQIIVGSFNEVPADLYAHMELYQNATNKLSNNSLGNALSVKQLFFQKAGVFYYLMASIAGVTSASAESVIAVVDFTNRTLFLIAVFFFTSSIFKNQHRPDLIAYLAVIFTALHMGINVFAYIRYYTLAPTILNMIIYMAATTLFLSVIAQSFKLKSLIVYAIIIALTCAAASIHVQEALFIGVMISVIAAIQTISFSKRVPIEHQTDIRQTLFISCLALTAFTSIYIYSNLNLPRSPNVHWQLWEFGSGIGLLPEITTLNLKFQFSRAMTLWGIFIYILFFLNIKRYRSNPFILAGMLSPAVTFLNPFFVDLFLRHYNSTTLWRLCYLIPIHFVAADLFIHNLPTFRDNRLLKRCINVIVTFTMIALLTPIKNTWNGVHYSRIPTLVRTNEKLGYDYYLDLLTYLKTLDQSRQVLTDPMTGYLISAMTKHESKRSKFFRSYRYKHFTFEDYSNAPLKRYKDYLLIVNKRQKSVSDIGSMSGHWSKHEWKYTHLYYTNQLTEHLESNPKRFDKQWENNDVLVYLIK